MKTKAKRKETGVLTNSEFDYIELAVMGRGVFRAAYLAGSGVAKAFVEATSEELRDARGQDELAELCVSAKRKAPHFEALGLGGFSERVEMQRAARVIEREASLESESLRRKAAGLSYFFDRRTERWVDEDSWRAVPFVDLPSKQVFHASHADL